MRDTNSSVPFLLAVIASAVGPLTQPGTQAWLSSVVGITVFVVLAAFTWPRSLEGAEADYPTWPVLAAHSIVYGFISAMSAAYFVQRDIEARSTRPSCNPPPPTGDPAKDLLDYTTSMKCQSDSVEELVHLSTAGSMWVGLLVTGGTFLALLATAARVRRRQSATATRVGRVRG